MQSPNSSVQRNRQALAAARGPSTQANSPPTFDPPPPFGSGASRSSRQSAKRGHLGVVGNGAGGGGDGMNGGGGGDELHSLRSTTTATTDELAISPTLKSYKRPPLTIPLMMIFLFQLGVVVGAFVGVTAYLVQSELRATDHFVRGILEQQLSEAEDEVLLPLFEHLRNLQKLAVSLDVYNGTFSSFPLSSDDAARSVSFYEALPTWKTMRISAATPSPLSSYLYTLVCGYFSPVAGQEGRCLVWVECGCSEDVCYITRDTNSTNIPLAGTTPTSSLDPALTNNSTYLPGVNQEYYVQKLLNVTSTIAWSDAYVWGTPGDPLWGQDVFVTSYYCMTFSALPTGNGDGTGGCVRAVAMDVNFTFTREILNEMVQREGEVVTLVDLTTDVVFLTTDASTPKIDPDAQTLWGVANIPVHGLFSSVTTYKRCVAEYARNISHCDQIVVLDNDDHHIVAMQAIYTYVPSIALIYASPVGPATLLLVKTIPRYAYYHDSDVALRNALTVVIVVCITAIVISVGIFFGITIPVQQLALNFQHASALENEKAEFGSTIVRELSELNEEFVVLNARLATARAFLPHAILLNGGLPPSHAEGSGIVLAAQLDGADADQFDGFSNNTSPTGQQATFSEIHQQGVDGEPHPSPMTQNPMDAPVPHVALGPPPSVSALAASGVGTGSPARHLNNVSGFTDLLHRRGVAVLCINVMSFERIITSWPEVGMRVHAAVLHEILAAVTARSGVVDNFHGDRFLITFNASVVCPAPAARAVEAMMELITRIFSRAHSKLLGGGVGAASLPAKILSGFGVRVGASCGPAMCGTIGNRSIQRFSTVGKCVGQAYSLMQFARTEMLSNVISEELLTHGVLDGASPFNAKTQSVNTNLTVSSTVMTTTINGTTAVEMGGNHNNALPNNTSATNPLDSKKGPHKQQQGPAPRFTPLSAADSEHLVQAAGGGGPPSTPAGGMHHNNSHQRELLFMLVGHGILPKDTKSTTMASMIGWRGGSLLQQPNVHPEDDPHTGSRVRERIAPMSMCKEGYYVVPHFLPVDPTCAIRAPSQSPPVLPPFQQSRHGGGSRSSVASSGDSNSSRDASRQQHVTAVDYHRFAGGGPLQAPHEEHIVSLRGLAANNEAFRLFVSGSFTKARQMLRLIPAPHDRFLQQALYVVAQNPSALHE